MAPAPPAHIGSTMTSTGSSGSSTTSARPAPRSIDVRMTGTAATTTTTSTITPSARNQRRTFMPLHDTRGARVSSAPIPFLDLVTPQVQLEEELVASFRTALRAAAFVGGSEVEAFEREFAEFCSARHCVGVGSGTDALRFALMAAGVQLRDTVVTVPNTFIATTEAISQAGGGPGFVGG